MIFTIIILPTDAKDRIKFNAKMETAFSLNENTPTTIKFIPDKTVKIGQEITIKPDSMSLQKFIKPEKKNAGIKPTSSLLKQHENKRKLVLKFSVKNVLNCKFSVKISQNIMFML